MSTLEELPNVRLSQSILDNTPFYPILNPHELGEIHDYRDQLEPAIRKQLSSADHVIHIVTPDIFPPAKKPSALRQVLRLSGAVKLNDIGHYGSPIASLADGENEGIDSLRKFEVVHSRDALEIAQKLHEHFPELLRTTLITLAETQGLENQTYQSSVPFREEERGRIMLLNRQPDDPIGQKFSDKLGWGWPFYGSIDATPKFISAISLYTLDYDASFLSELYKGKDGNEYSMKDAFERSTAWLINKLNNNSEGLLEFKNPTSKGGMSSQAWKDSAFAYVHTDGKRANLSGGIASIEVQALAYDALYDSASIYRVSGDEKRANELEIQANHLKDQIIKTFWIDDLEKGGYFALATDRDKNGNLQTMNVRSSNMGHLLQSRLLEADDVVTNNIRESIVKQLFSPELLQYNGIRTLANDEVGFRAESYHTGSVWLWDTAYIADGLERHNYHQLAWELRKRIWRTVEETQHFPEFVNGGDSQKAETNKSEIYVWNDEFQVLHLFQQLPQEIQGWTVSAILAAKYKYSDYLKQKKNLPTNKLEQSILEKL